MVYYKFQARKTPSYSNNEALVFKRGEPSPGSSPHWTTYVFGATGVVFGVNGVIISHVAHNFNVKKLEEEQREKKEKEEKEEEEAKKEDNMEKLRDELRELHSYIFNQYPRISAVEGEIARLTKEVVLLQRVLLDQANEAKTKDK
ncbi:hypothetical protein N7516_007420 [Penicillium verrucosum]|uniref:uncharacterized protein n=1 Tax=Penicillium verrucosum TaxID=60171 RepID=UPI00254507A3|nr:uncharacterized protein N7516_007420 [Penicillium verrucosum]KAJ5932931.1 hypothetical protein N7516_007420 [Penicillium verrucosum]